MPVPTRDGSNSTSDFLIDFVGKIGQRDTERPVRSVESSAVQQYDSVGLGKTKCQIEWVNILFEILNSFFADVLAGPELKIN